MADLNKVDTELMVAGTKTHFVSLYLSQAMNSHNHFEIEVDYEELDEKWMEGPATLIGLIGEPVNITMKHKQTGEENLFLGTITNVTMSGYHGQQNAVIISGKSPTIRLDGKDTMDSFMDKTLQQIVDEAVANSGNDGSVTSKPEFGGKLDYICQYNETCFEFLNRMSWLFGEWFFYNGKETFFGRPPEGDTVDITYDIEMTSFNLSANLTPPKYNRYYYLHHDDKEVDEDAPESVPGVQGYLQKSLDMSKKIYTSVANIPLNPIVTTKKELEDMLKAEKTRSVGEMLIMSGSTQTCKVKIGEKVKIKFPTTMEVGKKEVDTFTVTELTHNVDQKGHYSNNFKGILSELNNIPMSPCPAPIAGSQLAWVKSNADPKNKGRVQIQFQWQKKIGKNTNWVKVQTPDAGSSGKVAQNRGFVFVPEEGDMVMAGFEYGDPNRPFVAGSVFTETAGGGGGGTNKTKSLTTRSGSTVTLDDDNNKGSITISDPSGNTIILHGDNTISITAPDKITMTSKEIIINGTDLVHTISDKMIKEESSQKIESTANETVEIHGVNKIGITSNTLIEEGAPKVTISGKAQVEIGGALIDVTGNITNIKGKPLNLN